MQVSKRQVSRYCKSPEIDSVSADFCVLKFSVRFPVLPRVKPLKPLGTSAHGFPPARSRGCAAGMQIIQFPPSEATNVPTLTASTSRRSHPVLPVQQPRRPALRRRPAPRGVQVRVHQQRAPRPRLHPLQEDQADDRLQRERA